MDRATVQLSRPSTSPSRLGSALEPVKDRARTLTADKRKEFMGHAALALNFYYARMIRGRLGLSERTSGSAHQQWPKENESKQPLQDEGRRVQRSVKSRPHNIR